MWGQGRLQEDGAIQIGILVGGAADRGGLVPGAVGAHNDARRGSQARDGVRQRERSITNVGPQCHKTERHCAGRHDSQEGVKRKDGQAVEQDRS